MDSLSRYAGRYLSLMTLRLITMLGAARESLRTEISLLSFGCVYLIRLVVTYLGLLGSV